MENEIIVIGNTLIVNETHELFKGVLTKEVVNKAVQILQINSVTNDVTFLKRKLHWVDQGINTTLHKKNKQ